MKLSLKTIAGAATLAAALCLTLTPSAQAQGSSETTISTGHFTDIDAADFSKSIERDLADKGARIALVFRTGRTRDKLPDSINYTHGAFWVYQAFQTPNGEIMTGYNTWNLFHGDGEDMPQTQSYLAEEFPFTFVSASAVDDVAVIIPTPNMQDRLLELLASEAYLELHNRNYSLISNPADESFQNCVEFLLDVVSAAAWDTTDQAQLKANIAAHFEPSEIEAGLFARLFGPLADERLRLADHRGAAIQTATYESLSTFMIEHGLADETYKLAFERNESVPTSG
ncbi:MAG: DUF2145 domain-containing protein [Pseudomonadota bacterium]